MPTIYLDNNKTYSIGTAERAVSELGVFPVVETFRYDFNREPLQGFRGSGRTVVQKGGAFQSAGEGASPNGSWENRAESDGRGNLTWRGESQDSGGTRRTAVGSSQPGGSGKGTVEISDGTRIAFQYGSDGVCRAEITAANGETYTAESKTTFSEVPVHSPDGQRSGVRFSLTTETTIRLPDGATQKMTFRRSADGRCEIRRPDGVVERF